MNEKTKVATLSVVSNITLTLSKVIIGFLSGSVSILSEGIHSGIDLIAAIIALFAVKESGKPADSCHAYGHGKIENVSGTIEAALIFVAALMIIVEAIQKIREILSGSGGHVSDLGLGLGLLIMAVSAVMNFIVSTCLMRVAIKTDSVALEADALHLRTDVYTSLGVLLGLLIIKFTGWIIIDPIIALGVAFMIIRAAIDLSKKAFAPLVDVSLPDEERRIIAEVLQLYEKEFVEFHKLRTRKAGAERHVDLHLVVAKFTPVVDVHELCDRIEQEINEKLSITYVLIHAEPCSTREEECPVENGVTSTCQRCGYRPRRSNLRSEVRDKER
ncbi:cation diffusion facilitator family transporter [Desulfosporosinus meridiei]|uniref:Cation diffusion facilitator family transporter n=1 Tax=Desulfosporosinus meridiei (strain ATCC BAA-275 / DSM 13257 / KCTC 12902 / NCIMB 13706 / S10) TaxID=768704 RepID=J7IME2_DESMD|nr:cation diffusion facilitator family transporter [Desulfosporosinus meridiei]AFQ42967.1 cation diffusion facilitator family transporter [Desulfosporosinus meridiei DSM 13257]